MSQPYIFPVMIYSIAALVTVLSRYCFPDSGNEVSLGFGQCLVRLGHTKRSVPFLDHPVYLFACVYVICCLCGVINNYKLK